MVPHKKLTILYVITKGTWGGAQRYVFDLAKAAQGEGHDVAVAYGAPGLLGQMLRAANIRSIELPQMGRDVSVGADLASLKELRRVLKEMRPDVLHLNSSKAGVIGALAGRLEGVPRIIFTAHGWALNEDRPLWQKIPIGMLYYLTIILSHQTIAVSQQVKKDAQWMPFVSKKILVIHNGISKPAFKSREIAREVLASQADKVWIGINAELHPTKRINDAIVAMVRVAKEFPDTILVVMGEGEARAQLEQMTREHRLEERVFLLGFVADAASYLLAYDIFLLPSRTEGLAYAILEAGAAGLPVVATNVGGIPEIIEDRVSGLLVPALDSAAIAQALLLLLRDSALREKFGSALAARVAQEFSIEQTLDKTFALYRSAS